jgi:ribonuclease BN (tRNA processing enzyme)
MKSYAYRFETPHGAIVFTGDTGPSDAVTRLAQDADVLVSEVEDKAAIGAVVDRMAQQNHWSTERRHVFERHMTDELLGFEDVGQMATKAHVKSVLLYHWNPANPAAEVAAVSKYFSGPVLGSADLQRYCLAGRSSADQSRQPPLRLCE